LSGIQSAWGQIAWFIGTLIALVGVILSHRSLKQRQKEWETARMDAENKRAMEIVRREAERDRLVGEIGRDLKSISEDHREYGRKIDKICEAWAALTGKTINGVHYRPEGD